MTATTVYRLYDADDALLYIGISGSFMVRFVDHGRDKAWWHEVARAEMQHMPTRQAALEIERASIGAERPRYNVVHNCEPKARSSNACRQPAKVHNDLLLLAAAHQDVLDAIDTRNRLAAWLIYHDNVTSRALAELCGVTHQTVRNWAAKA